MEQTTFKTTVVLVGMGQQTRVYRSLQAIPSEVRSRIVTTAEQGGSATILIADRAGRQQISRAIRGLPSGVKLRAASTFRRRRLKRAAAAVDWVEVTLFGLAGIFTFIAVALS